MIRWGAVVAKKPLPRGLRLNNPGNIDRTNPRTPWQGRVPDDQLSDPRFEQFTGPAWGIRALCRTLITYQDKHGLASVRGIINRWAPPNENDSAVYVNAVAEAMGVEPFADIDVTKYETMLALAKAIVRHENGNPKTFGYPPDWYDADTWDEGLKLAGIVPGKPVSVVKDPVVQGSTVAAVAGTITVADSLGLVKQFVQPGSNLGTVAGVLALLAAVYLIYRVYRKRKAQAS